MKQEERDKPDLEEYDSQHVIDEEGSVDQAIKKRILNSRQAINENENMLFTERVISPEINLTEAQAVMAWGHSVRRYIRDVEVLLKDDEIPESSRYYEEVKLGEVTLVPPDTEEYEFSLFANEKWDNKTLKKQMGLPPGCEVPEPFTKTFTGLGELLESDDVVTHSWELYIDKTGAPEKWETVTLESGQVIPKEVYEKAVRFTDGFLQNAGIGVKTGTPEEDDESEAW